VELAGGRAVRVPLLRPGFRVDWDRVRDAISPRTRLLIVNSPHNPSGAVFAPDDLDALEDAVRDTGVLLLSDEVYEHIIFDGRAHQSLLTRPALASRSFVVSSFGKTFHCTGWKVGYCVAPPGLTSEFRKVHQFVQFAVASPLQAALAQFLVECPGHALELGTFYQGKRDRFLDLLAGTPLRPIPTAGTYFQLADYSAVSQQPDLDFAQALTRDIGVAAIPVSVFSTGGLPERLVRFCFAKNDATLDAAGDRLSRLVARGECR